MKSLEWSRFGFEVSYPCVAPNAYSSHKIRGLGSRVCGLSFYGYRPFSSLLPPICQVSRGRRKASRAPFLWAEGVGARHLGKGGNTMPSCSVSCRVVTSYLGFSGYVFNGFGYLDSPPQHKKLDSISLKHNILTY